MRASGSGAMGEGVRSIRGKHLLATSAILVVLTAATPPLRAQGQASGPQVSQTTQRSFNIAPQPLSSALPLFGQQSGRQITADAALVRGLNTPGVQGTMAIDEALRRLLAGTGLTFSGMAGDTIALQRATQGGQLPPGMMQLDPVRVQGYPVPPQAMIDNIPPPYAGGQVATGAQLGVLGNRDVMETPFNQTSYTAKKAQDQQARSVRQILNDDPSIRFYVPDGGVGAELINIRSFNVQNNAWMFGGLFGLVPTFSVMPEMAERIEVLKGPSAMLNGMSPSGAIGGTINIVPKRATDAPITQATASYTSSAQFGGAADVGRRFGADKQFGVRINGAFRAGQTDLQYNSDQRALVAAGLDFRGETVRASADLGYQSEYIVGVVPYLGLANNVPLPWAPNVRNNPGAQPWSNRQTKDLFGAVRAEVDMLETVTAYINVGAHDSRYGQLYGTDIVTITNVNGTATARPAIQNSYAQIVTGEAGVRGRFDTGPAGHEAVFSGTFYESAGGIASTLGTVYATDIYNPTIIAQPSMANPAANKTGTQSLQSLVLADTLSSRDKRVQLTAGLRLQQVGASNFNPLTGVRTSSYEQNALSPSVALVIRPWRQISFYGNFIQGLQQGTIVGAAFANAGEIFPPFKSTQYEAGVKVDWGKFTTTASLFQITQPSILTNTATNTQFPGGLQRNRGLELNFFGEPIEGVRLLGGAMFLDAVLAQTQRGATDGWIAPFSPNLQLRIAGEWDLPFVRGLTVNGRVSYTGSQYIDTTWPRRSLPDWTRVDIGARYVFDTDRSPTGNPIALRFNVENLFDTNYWAGGSGATTLFLGMPRTFRVSLTADF
ncbi:MAG: TonB-dependent siderophore receptor [Rhodospirillales bacterium]|nr:TonB-dependent siderophore receptor [Rhodospirillales bacterium]